MGVAQKPSKTPFWPLITSPPSISMEREAAAGVQETPGCTQLRPSTKVLA